MSRLEPELEKYRASRYNIAVRVIPPGASEEESIDLGPDVMEMRIIKDYDGASMPYYRMTAGISVDTARRLHKNWRQSRVIISIRRLEVPDKDEGDVPVDTLEDYVKDAEFRIMETSIDVPAEVPEDTENVSDSPVNTKSTIAQFEMVPNVALLLNKKTNVGAFHNVRIHEVVTLLTQRNDPGVPGYEYWMMPPDNKRNYESIVLPPLCYSAAIRHLDKVYGLYSGQLNVFMDAGTTHIMSSAKRLMVPEGKPLGVVLEVRPRTYTSQEMTSAGSAYEPDERTYRLRAIGTAEVAVAGPARRESEGDHVRLVRSSHRERAGSDCKDVYPEAPEMLPENGVWDKKRTILWQTYDNELTVDRLRKTSREQYSPMAVMFENPDIKAFAPELTWAVLTQGKEQNWIEGKWRISAVEIVLTTTPETPEPFTAAVMAKLLPATA